MSSKARQPYNLYRFQHADWIKSSDFTKRDVVIIVDAAQKRVYYHEGPRSTAHDHEMAKSSLIRYKNQYPHFSFFEIPSLEQPPKNGVPNADKIVAMARPLRKKEKNL